MGDFNGRSDFYKSTTSDVKGTYVFISNDDGSNPVTYTLAQEVFFKKIYVAEFSMNGISTNADGSPTVSHVDVVFDGNMPKSFRVNGWVHANSKPPKRIPFILSGANTHSIYTPKRLITDSSGDRVTSFDITFQNPDDSNTVFKNATLLLYLEN